MSIDPNEPHADDEIVLARYDAELASDNNIADLVAHADVVAPIPVPLVAGGGRAEEWVKPAISGANTVRDTVRLWAPGIVDTTAFGVVLFAPVPVPITGPLTVYAGLWAGFGWWTAAGRPGPSDSVVLLGRAIATGARWIAIAAVAIGGHIGKGAHTITAPMRRTVVQPVLPAAEGR
ncbi:hypothetical protein [Nocardia sp. NBC_00403]|uniref:hypothetical protein n=1 Tax=Nocardia sp. NBC_00403 TaxID=2975990 RepID=UPI002E214EC7